METRVLIIVIKQSAVGRSKNSTNTVKEVTNPVTPTQRINKYDKNEVENRRCRFALGLRMTYTACDC